MLREEVKGRINMILVQTGLGRIEEVNISDCVVVVLFKFTPDTVKSLWSRIVFDLSINRLANGILDIPMRLFSDNLAVIWVGYQAIVCQSSSQHDLIDFSSVLFSKPEIPHSISLAIGGPCGVGKTTLIRNLKRSSIGGRVRTYIAYTTRPRRKFEVHGVDYFFVNPEDLHRYQNDPRFINFVEARGYWYWTEPARFFESKWNEDDAIHLSTITQSHEFLERRIIVPDLKWIWLDAQEGVLRQRLSKRGDDNIENSLELNKRMASQDKTGLVSLNITAESDNSEEILLKLIQFIETISKERGLK